MREKMFDGDTTPQLVRWQTPSWCRARMTSFQTIDANNSSSAMTAVCYYCNVGIPSGEAKRCSRCRSVPLIYSSLPTPDHRRVHRLVVYCVRRAYIPSISFSHASRPKVQRMPKDLLETDPQKTTASPSIGRCSRRQGSRKVLRRLGRTGGRHAFDQVDRRMDSEVLFHALDRDRTRSRKPSAGESDDSLVRVWPTRGLFRLFIERVYCQLASCR
jgi:hypothetical protein